MNTNWREILTVRITLVNGVKITRENAVPISSSGLKIFDHFASFFIPERQRNDFTKMKLIKLHSTCISFNACKTTEFAHLILIFLAFAAFGAVVIIRDPCLASFALNQIVLPFFFDRHGWVGVNLRSMTFWSSCLIVCLMMFTRMSNRTWIQRWRYWNVMSSRRFVSRCKRKELIGSWNTVFVSLT